MDRMTLERTATKDAESRSVVSSDAATPTFAELIARVRADPSLSAVQRRDYASALSSLARHLGRRAEAIEASFVTLRPVLASREPPAGSRLSRKTWANLRTLGTVVLVRYGAPRRAATPRQLTDAWRELRARHGDERLQRGLSRFIHFASARGIAPAAVDDAALASFATYLNEGTLVAKPDRIHQRTAVLWNQAVASVPGWPARTLSVPRFRKVVMLPVERFPAGFGADLERWLAVLGGADPFDERSPPRPLRPATLFARRYQVLRAAACLVHSGVPAERIQGLADLVTVEAFKSVFTWYVGHLGGVGPSLEELAHTLVGIARHWVPVSPEQLAELKRLKQRLGHRERGLTTKNRERLRQFYDESAIDRLLLLPPRLLELARRSERPRAAALLVQSALAVEILLTCPIRLANLAGLHGERHLHRSRRGEAGPVHVVIPAAEVKNGRELEFALTREGTRLLDLYQRRHRSRLLPAGAADAGWLFPGGGRGPKHVVSLSQQLVRAIRRHTGLVMNVHLFRHFAALLYLRRHPGEYATVQQLLGHKSVNTTIAFYAGFETLGAVRRYDEQILAPRRRAQG